MTRSSCSIFLLFPLRVRVALDRVERQPGFSAVIGVIAAIAVVPLAILLALSVIGIPLIVLEAAALFVGIWIGKGAVAILIGRRIFELARPQTTPAPLVALLIGLVALSLAEIIPLLRMGDHRARRARGARRDDPWNAQRGSPSRQRPLPEGLPKAKAP